MSNIGPGFYCKMRDEQCLDHKEAEVKRLLRMALLLQEVFKY